MRTLSLSVCVLTLLATACSDDQPPEPVPPPLHREVLFHAAVPVSLQDVFEHPDRAVLFTIISDVDFDIRQVDPALRELPRLHDWHICDSAELTTQETESLSSTFRRAIVEGEFNSKSCIFAPHHVLRLEKDTRYLEIVVCFQCHEYQVLPEGGYKNINLNKDVGLEEAWRDVVAKHGLRDYSLDTE
ncbi:MAG: hypothetical protein R3E76_02355 [Planctomycetota bacterium]